MNGNVSLSHPRNKREESEVEVWKSEAPACVRRISWETSRLAWCFIKNILCGKCRRRREEEREVCEEKLPAVIHWKMHQRVKIFTVCHHEEDNEHRTGTDTDCRIPFSRDVAMKCSCGFGRCRSDTCHSPPSLFSNPPRWSAGSHRQNWSFPAQIKCIVPPFSPVV